MWFAWYPYDSFGLDALTFASLVCTLVAIGFLHRRIGTLGSSLVYLFVGLVLCVLQQTYLDTQTFGSIFGMLRVMCWELFFFGPLACAIAALQEHRVWLQRCLWAAAIILVSIGVDAFLIEPRRLQVTRYVLSHPKIKSSKRMVLISDIQTDVLDAHTERALRTAIEQEPDLIVFSGDYLQFSFQRDFPPNIEPFNHLLRDLGYDRIPSIAVEGDVEAALGKDWYALFAGLPVTILDPSSRTSWQEIDIVGLNMRDSKKGLWSQPSDPSRFTVILGHNPNFSLKRPEADLYLAGHTHGGQVQLPLIGPLITLSDVPRDQAHGRSELENGATMIVSRGIGMERYDAPRLRFLCLPEIVVIDLQPST